MKARRRVDVPRPWIRASVVACVLVTAAICVFRIDHVLGLFDWRADQNAALGYLERIYADAGVVGDRRVVEEARVWMPDDATYRVVYGPRLRADNRYVRPIAADFLKYFLLPRRQTTSTSARWVFCYGCDTSALGPGFVVLADGGDGILFGRVGP